MIGLGRSMKSQLASELRKPHARATSCRTSNLCGPAEWHAVRRRSYRIPEGWSMAHFSLLQLQIPDRLGGRRWVSSRPHADAAGPTLNRQEWLGVRPAEGLQRDCARGATNVLTFPACRRREWRGPPRCCGGSPAPANGSTSTNPAAARSSSSTKASMNRTGLSTPTQIISVT
jgi:hypothetical protein